MSTGLGRKNRTHGIIANLIGYPTEAMSGHVERTMTRERALLTSPKSVLLTEARPCCSRSGKGLGNASACTAIGRFFINHKPAGHFSAVSSIVRSARLLCSEISDQFLTSVVVPLYLRNDCMTSTEDRHDPCGESNILQRPQTSTKRSECITESIIIQLAPHTPITWKWVSGDMSRCHRLRCATVGVLPGEAEHPAAPGHIVVQSRRDNI